MIEDRVSKNDVERLTGQTYQSLVDRYASAMRIPSVNRRLAGQWGDLSRLDQGPQVTISQDTFDTILSSINKVDRS